MENRVQRILLIVLMVGILIYTIINYANGRTDQTMLIITLAFLGFFLFGQVSALIREWKE